MVFGNQFHTSKLVVDMDPLGYPKPYTPNPKPFTGYEGGPGLAEAAPSLQVDPPNDASYPHLRKERARLARSLGLMLFHTRNKSVLPELGRQPRFRQKE